MSQKDIIGLSLFDAESRMDWKKEGRNRDVLEHIERFLSENGMNNKDVQGIMVVAGAGSFTNTRISTVVANAFAYARRIPVMTIRSEQTGTAPDYIAELVNLPTGQYISAEYSGEPNIGKEQRAFFPHDGSQINGTLFELRLIVHGRVQGVSFREHTARFAAECGLTGWCRNRAEGTFEVVAEGEKTTLEKLKKWCENGPSCARVEKMDEAWKEITERRNAHFHIRH